MDVDMFETMERTREALVRHLCDLMDEIDYYGGRIASRRILGGIHESLESLSYLNSMQNNSTETMKNAVPKDNPVV